MDRIVFESTSKTVSICTAAVAISDGPKHLAFVSLTSRLNSFKNWQFGTVQLPLNLARAGFFHSGVVDRVICFYCGVCLCKWEKLDNPWIDHAIHSSTCAFLLLNKSNWSPTQSTVRNI